METRVGIRPDGQQQAVSNRIAKAEEALAKGVELRTTEPIIHGTRMVGVKNILKVNEQFIFGMHTVATSKEIREREYLLPEHEDLGDMI